jgi:hypothetical protein
MSSIVIKGNTSGQVEIAAPDVAGSTTLTLPTNTGNIVTTGDSATVTQGMIGSGVAGTGPAFLAQRLSVQSVPLNTTTIFQLDVETNDTDNCFNNTSSAVNGIPPYSFMPNVAGYYNITGFAVTQSPSTGYYMNVYIFKNGVGYVQVGGGGGNGTAWFHGGCSVLVYLNGTTDYVGLYGLTNVTNNMTAYMSGHLVRAA